MPLSLYLFMVANLVVGTGAFVLGGILQPLATDLAVSVPAAGQVMTAYALASAVLAPVFIVATGRWSRTRALKTAFGLYLLGCVACALAPSLGLLLVGRVLMGAGSAFTALAAGVAVALAPAAQRGRALSLNFLGISLSYAIGLPLGTWLGFALGWAAPLWLVAGCGAAVLLLLLWGLRQPIDTPGASFAAVSVVARRPAVWRVWCRTLLYFVAIFCVFAYIGPVLQALTPLSSTGLSVVIMLFGLSGIGGTVLGGWAADRWGPRGTLRVALAVLTVTMVLLPLTRGHLAACVAVMVIWGLAGFSMMTPQQSLLAGLAPAHAPVLLSINSSMLYLGTSLGAIVGGALIGPLGLDRLAWAGVPFAVLAWGTLWFQRPADAERPDNPAPGGDVGARA